MFWHVMLSSAKYPVSYEIKQMQGSFVASGSFRMTNSGILHQIV